MTLLAAKSHLFCETWVILSLLLVKADIFQDQDLHQERH